MLCVTFNCFEIVRSPGHYYLPEVVHSLCVHKLRADTLYNPHHIPKPINTSLSLFASRMVYCTNKNCTVIAPCITKTRVQNGSFTSTITILNTLEYHQKLQGSPRTRLEPQWTEHGPNVVHELV